MIKFKKKLAIAGSFVAIVCGQSVCFASDSQDRQDQQSPHQVPLQMAIDASHSSNAEPMELENAMTQLPVGIQDGWIELKVIEGKNIGINEKVRNNLDKMPPVGINNLPKDVMLKIFSLVNKESNLVGLARVCKRWRKHIYEAESINKNMTYEIAPAFARAYMDARWERIFRNAKLSHYKRNSSQFSFFSDAFVSAQYYARNDHHYHGKYSSYYFTSDMAEFFSPEVRRVVTRYNIAVLVITRAEALKSAAEPLHPLHSVTYQSRNRNAPILIFFRKVNDEHFNNFEYVNHLPIRELSEKNLYEIHSKSICNIKCAKGYVPLKECKIIERITRYPVDEWGTEHELTYDEEHLIMPDLSDVIFSCYLTELPQARPKQNSCNLM